MRLPQVAVTTRSLKITAAVVGLAMVNSAGAVTADGKEPDDRPRHLSHSHAPPAFSPDGETIAWRSPDRSVTLWDVATGRRRATLKGHPEEADSVAYSPDGKTLAVGCMGGAVRLWDAETNRERATLRIGDPYPAGFSPRVVAILRTMATHAVAFTPDGKTLASVGPHGLVLWDLATRKPRARLIAAYDLEANCNLSVLAFSRDGRVLAATGSSPDRGPGRSRRRESDLLVWLFDPAGVRPRRALRAPGGPSLCMAIAPDGRTLAAGGYGGEVVLWDIASGRTLRTLRGRETAVEVVAYSPDGKLVATAASNDVRLWDGATGVQRARVEGLLEAPTFVGGMAFSPDGRALAIAHDDEGEDPVKVWDVAAFLKRPVED